MENYGARQTDSEWLSLLKLGTHPLEFLWVSAHLRRQEKGQPSAHNSIVQVVVCSQGDALKMPLDQTL
jgi:hypothetical protein